MVLYRKGIPIWRDTKIISWAAQILSTILVISLLVFLISNLLNAANNRGFSLGFDFIHQEAGFPISESVVDYKESDSFLHAFYVGILNTIRVAFIGIFFATILGTLLGIARVSTNWALKNLSLVYVEIFRNIPLLVQLFFWYFIIFQSFPKVQDAISLPGEIYLSNRGIFLPNLVFSTESAITLFACGCLIILMIFSLYKITALPETYFARIKRILVYMASAITIVILVYVLTTQLQVSIDTPELGKFNFEGGLRITPEFAALLLGLTIYTASFIAEIVRAGIQSVPKGQYESAYALGLSKTETLKLIILPQALKVIIPPMINQYLNLSKNSSLAIAIGYPDAFFVGRTMINQAGRAVPIFGMVMLCYGLISLMWSVMGNLFNRKTNVGRN
ncbi:MAG: ABC transporter permease subunit [Chloroflexota bacterium]|nr:ABC transporter permease subunit [Chloroflexota bacterium]